MRKALKIILPILLALILLATGYWFFFLYRADLPAGLCVQIGDKLLASGNAASAVNYYNYAYRLAPGDSELALKLSEFWKASGNYTKTEYVLVNAIRNAPDNLDLYLALSQAYVDQDKLLDAQQMLDNVMSESAKATLEQLRPAAPVIQPEGGYYRDYISVSLAEMEGANQYLSIDGTIPSLADGAYTEPVELPRGASTVCAVAVNDRGLVSTASYAGYTVAGLTEDVTFADPVLEAYMQEVLNKEGRVIKTSDLWGLSELTVPDDVTVLTDLVHFTGLTSLTIHGYKGDDYAFLADMPSLRYLDLTNCTVSSDALALIGGLSQLEELYLDNCGISKISSLAELTKLRILHLNDNSVHDLSPVEPMERLEELYLSRAAVTGLGSIAKLPALKKLDVSYNTIEAISSLARCATLEDLNLSENNISDISSLRSLVNLVRLDVSGNTIEDISALSACSKLVSVILSRNSIHLIDALAGITTISELSIDNNQIEALPKFADGSQLSNLLASHNLIPDVNGLAGLAVLNYVDLDYNPLSDISPLASCPLLIQVNVFGTEVTDVSVLKDKGVIVNYDPT